MDKRVKISAIVGAGVGLLALVVYLLLPATDPVLSQTAKVLTEECLKAEPKWPPMPLAFTVSRKLSNKQSRRCEQIETLLVGAPKSIQGAIHQSRAAALAVAQWPELTYLLGELARESGAGKEQEAIRTATILTSLVAPLGVVTTRDKMVRTIKGLLKHNGNGLVRVIHAGALPGTLECLDNEGLPNKILDAISTATDPTQWAKACNEIKSIPGQKLLEKIVRHSRAYDGLLVAAPSALFALDLLLQVEDGAAEFGERPPAEIKARVNAAIQSKWPRVELLIDVQKLDAGSLTPLEMTTYLDWLQQKPAPSILEEVERPRAQRMITVMGLALKKSSPELSFPLSKVPELVTKAAKDSQKSVDEIREAVLLATTLHWAVGVCHAKENRPQECRKRAKKWLSSDKVWVRAAMLLNHRVAELLLLVPGLHKVFARIAQNPEMAKQLANKHVKWEDRATLHLVMVAERIFDSAIDQAGHNEGIGLLKWVKKKTITLTTDRNTWRQVISLGRKYDLKKVALLVFENPNNIQKIKKSGKGFLDVKKVNYKTKELETDWFNWAINQIFFVKLIKAQYSADPSLKDIAKMALWDLLVIVPVGRVAKFATKLIPTSLRFGTSLLGKTPVLSGASKSMKQIAGKLTIKSIPTLYKLLSRLLTSKHLGPAMRFVGTRRGFITACAGLSVVGSAVSVKVFSNESPFEAKGLAKIIGSSMALSSFCYYRAKSSKIRLFAKASGKITSVPGLPRVVLRVLKSAPGAIVKGTKVALTAVSLKFFGPQATVKLIAEIKLLGPEVAKRVVPHLERALGGKVLRHGGKVAADGATRGVASYAGGEAGVLVLTVLQNNK